MSILKRSKVVGNKILVKPDSVDEKSAGGIIIVKEAQERPQFGTIVLAGPDTINATAGSRIMHGKYAGTEVEIENEAYLIMKEDDLLLITEEESTVTT